MIVRTVRIITCRCLLSYLAMILVIASVVAGCGNREAVESQSAPLRSPVPSDQPKVQSTIQPIATVFVPELLADADLDLQAGPIDIPLTLQIPALQVNAPVWGVGLTSENVMDSPKGPIGDPVWHTAFWYRGSGIPGDVGTATIAGHVNDPLGRPEIFAHLEDLQPGDLIIIRDNNTSLDIRFIVDQTKVYSIQESSDPVVLEQIFGTGPVTGTEPQPAPDGFSHLTLITCAGYIVNGRFDHHTVVYATRSE